MRSVATLEELSRCKAAHTALVTTLCCDTETSPWVHEQIVQLERYTAALLAHRMEESLRFTLGKTMTSTLIALAKIKLLQDLTTTLHALGEPTRPVLPYKVALIDRSLDRSPPSKPFWRRWLLSW